jgi:hypothetical protein
LQEASEKLRLVGGPEYVSNLTGTLGLDPSLAV